MLEDIDAGNGRGSTVKVDYCQEYQASREKLEQCRCGTRKVGYLMRGLNNESLSFLSLEAELSGDASRSWKVT